MNETISKADLISLLDVVEAATGLYNAVEILESMNPDDPDLDDGAWAAPARAQQEAFDNLGMKLRVLGLSGDRK